MNLNWEINPGNQYLITTNIGMNNDNFGDNNPMLKRTTDGIVQFPFTINNILSITAGYYDGGEDANSGSSEDYYYYFYDWKINNEWGIGGSSCFSEIVEVEVMINEDNTTISEQDIDLVSIYPNPTKDKLNIVFNYSIENTEIVLFDHLGKFLQKMSINSIQS